MKNEHYQIDAQNSDLADRYVRGELSELDLEQFEQRLFDDEALQDAVQLALSLRHGLSEVSVTSPELFKPEQVSAKTNWIPKWLAAGPSAVVDRLAPVFSTAFAAFAVLSLGLYLNAQQKISGLTEQLNQPQTVLSSVNLPQVRSSAGFESMGVLQRQDAQGWLVMQLELSWPEQRQYNVDILNWPEQTTALALHSVSVDAEDNLTFAVHAQEMPAGEYLAHVVYDDGQHKQLVAKYAFSVVEEAEK